MTCEEHKNFYSLPMRELDRKLDEYIEHGEKCLACSERERKLEELASEAIVAFVTDMPLDDIPPAEYPPNYVYMSKERLFK